MAAIAPFSMDAYLPAMPAIAADLNVDIVKVNFTLSAFLVGYAVGQLFGGPISDQIGRRKVGMTGLAVFVVASFAITVSTSIEHITWLRAVQAFGGGCASVICMAMIRDAYEPTEAAKRFSIMMLIVLVAPLVAPIVGAFLLDLGWQSVFVFIGFYGVVVFGAFVAVPETAPAVIGRINLRGILPQYIEVLRREVSGKRLPMRYILTMGFVTSTMMIFITNSSFIYIEYFGVSPKLFPLFFGANVVAMMICTFATTRLLSRFTPYSLIRCGCRLQLVTILILALATVSMDVPLWLFTLLVALTIGMSGLINPSASALYMAHFDRQAGSASSLATVSMFLLGGLLGAASGLFYDGSLRPIVFTMATSVVVANVIARSIPLSEGEST